MVKKIISKKKKRTLSWSEIMTYWIGTPLSIWLHSIFFVGIFALELVGFGVDQILLILTTAVSLEAIYLAIFIQMSVNRTSQSLAEVEADIDEIQEDVEDLSEDFDDISEDIQEIQAEEDEDNIGDEVTKKTLENIEKQMQVMLLEIETLKKGKS